MQLKENLARWAGRALKPIRSSERRLATRRIGGAAARLDVSSGSFARGGPIARRHAVEGGSILPALRWSAPPASAKEIVLLVEDPDAPLPKPFVHWLMFGIPPVVTEIPEEGPVPIGAVQGKASTGDVGYTGPNPPRGHGVHRYHFQVFAIDTRLMCGAGASRDEIVDAMKDHVVAWGETIGTYER